MTIIESFQDRRLFGALSVFRDRSSWRAWLVFLKAMYGLPQDVRAALRKLFSYARAPFVQVAALKDSVTRMLAASIALKNNVTLGAYPCRPHAIRGLRARVAICDELAFYRSSEGFPADAEMLRAIRPCLATTGGKLIVLSSPYAQTGALHSLYQRHYARGR